MPTATGLTDTLTRTLSIPREHVAVHVKAHSLSEDISPPDAIRLLIGLVATSTPEDAPGRVRAIEALPAVAAETRRVVNGIEVGSSGWVPIEDYSVLPGFGRISAFYARSIVNTLLLYLIGGIARIPFPLEHVSFTVPKGVENLRAFFETPILGPNRVETEGTFVYGHSYELAVPSEPVRNLGSENSATVPGQVLRELAEVFPEDTDDLGIPADLFGPPTHPNFPKANS